MTKNLCVPATRTQFHEKLYQIKFSLLSGNFVLTKNIRYDWEYNPKKRQQYQNHFEFNYFIIGRNILHNYNSWISFLNYISLVCITWMKAFKSVGGRYSLTKWIITSNAYWKKRPKYTQKLIQAEYNVFNFGVHWLFNIKNRQFSMLFC